MAQISITRIINYGGKVWNVTFHFNIDCDEMTSSRWHLFNDMEHLAK